MKKGDCRHWTRKERKPGSESSPAGLSVGISNKNKRMVGKIDWGETGKNNVALRGQGGFLSMASKQQTNQEEKHHEGKAEPFATKGSDATSIRVNLCGEVPFRKEETSIGGRGLIQKAGGLERTLTSC